MLSAVNTSPVHIMYLRKKNTWYSVRDGNWTDPNIWSSNGSGRRGHKYPQDGDNVVVSHTIALDSAVYINFAYSINDLTVTGKLLINVGSGASFNIKGNLYADAGTIDMTGAAISFNVFGPVTNFGTLIPGTNNTVGFVGSCSQYISKPLSGDFYSIYIFDPNYVYGNIPVTKYLMYDMTNVVSVGTYQVILELGNYNIEFNSAGFTLTGYSPPGGVIPALSRKGTGTTVFKQFCTGYSGMDLGNNPVEFRNGVSSGGTINASEVRFTTNNQTIKNMTTTAATPILIGSGVKLSVGDANSNTYTTVGKTIDGTDSTSILEILPKAYITFTGIAFEPMATGHWLLNGSVYYSFSGGSFTIRQGNYQEFQIVQSTQCNYTLGTNIVAGSASIYLGSLDLSGYDMTVNGAMYLQSAQLRRTGSGSTVFKGLFGYGGSSLIDLGSNVLELQAGLRNTTSFDVNNWTVGTLLLSTANQSFNVNSAGNSLSLTGNIEIAPGLTVTNVSNITLNGILNGQSASSVFDCQGLFSYRGAQVPMQTGILRCNTANNTFEYALLGNQDVTAGIYRNLTLSGSGAKKLLGNVSVVNIYKLTSPATLNQNGFALTNP